MQASDREKFNELLGQFFAAIDRTATPDRYEAFWQALQPMSMAELGRCRDRFLEDLRTQDAPRQLRVSDIWRIRRSLRAQAPRGPVDDGWRGDDWDRRANLLLLAYVLGRTPAQLKAWGRCASYAAMRTTARGPLDASPEFVARVGWLVEFKNAWARDMREWDGVPTIAQQRSNWDELMRRAEAA